MGENLVGCCLMLGSAMHNKLAIRLIQQYPKLINDIFISEDYYGKVLEVFWVNLSKCYINLACFG